MCPGLLLLLLLLDHHVGPPVVELLEDIGVEQSAANRIELVLELVQVDMQPLVEDFLDRAELERGLQAAAEFLRVVGKTPAANSRDAPQRAIQLADAKPRRARKVLVEEKELGDKARMDFRPVERLVGVPGAAGPQHGDPSKRFA